jgi:hypothetical protein
VGIKAVIHEIHRRFMWQVAAIHLTGAWIGYQVAGAVTTALELPSWAPTLALILLLLGLPVTLTTACLQEGLRDMARSADLQPEGSNTARRLFTWRNAILGGVLAFILWVITASGWLMFADQLIDSVQRPGVE